MTLIASVIYSTWESVCGGGKPGVFLLPLKVKCLIFQEKLRNNVSTWLETAKLFQY